jgi:RloB-like protein
MSKGRISTVRSPKGFRRTEAVREIRRTLLIVCEGVTEERYLKNLKRSLGLTNAAIVINSGNRDSAPMNLVRKAESIHATDKGYDFIYCVFDRDQHTSFQAARNRIRELAGRSRRPIPIAEAVSVPSFELWALLHYEKTDRAFNNSHEIQDRLVQLGCVEKYDKGDDTFSKILVGRVSTAIAHALWLEKRTNIIDENPMTNVHRLIELIKTL